MNKLNFGVMMTDKDYKPQLPETDTNLQNNPHYWLYKVTREALDNKEHPLHSLGHIWNRWACEGLSEGERGEFGIKIDDYSVLSDDEREKIRNKINEEIQHFNTEKIIWDFSSIDKEIDFSATMYWHNETNFNKFIFIKNVNFSVLSFMKNISFVDTKFIEKADFGITIFAEDADFRFSIFLQDTNFEKTTFGEEADFYNSTFTQKANFHKTNFLGNADFSDSKFKENADFWNATFKQTVDFSSSKFMGNSINFNGAKFFKPTNPEAIFSFKNTIFATKVNFSESEFHHLPNLTGTDFRAGINLDKVKFPSDLVENMNDKATSKSPPSLGEGWVGDSILHYKSLLLLSPPPSLPQRGRDKENYSQRGRDNIDCPIKGGLETYKDAVITWHALQTEMEKAGYHEQAVTYFGYELEAKYLDENTDTSFKWVLWFYKHISSYGHSIAKPFWWWIGLICLFWFLHFFIFLFTYSIDMQFGLYPIKKLLISCQLSLKGAFPFISDQTTFFDRMFDNNDNMIPASNILELTVFPLLHGVHTLLSLILIFLFGLGVRHRLRLK